MPRILVFGQNFSFQMFEGKRIVNEQANFRTIYTFGKLLGRGGFADVYEAIDSNSRKVAVKVSAKADAGSKKSAGTRLKSEVEIMRRLDHRNILKYLSHFQDETNIYLVLQLCQMNSLHELLKNRKSLTEMEVKYILKEILVGLQYLKSMSVIHRDIKVCNIMLTRNLQVKIGDFGLAACCPERIFQKHSTVCGTPNYMPPEIIKKCSYSFEVDVWSSGILMHNLLFGKCPFTGETQKETYENIIALRFKQQDQIQTLTQEARDLLRQMLNLNQRDRIKVEVILSHPFFQKQMLSQLPRMIYVKCLRKQELLEYCIDPQQKEHHSSLPAPLRKNPMQSNPFLQHTYLRHFQDISKKFGLCYQLTNKTHLILFNDNTCMAYIERTQQTFYQSYKGEKKPIMKFEKGQVPADICIRRKYFAVKDYAKRNKNDEPTRGDEEMQPDKLVRLLRCWARSKVAYMFSLRYLVQIYYIDGSFLLIQKKTGKIGLFSGNQLEILPPNSLQECDKSPHKEKLKLAFQFIKQLVKRDNRAKKRQYL